MRPALLRDIFRIALLLVILTSHLMAQTKAEPVIASNATSTPRPFNEAAITNVAPSPTGLYAPGNLSLAIGSPQSQVEYTPFDLKTEILPAGWRGLDLAKVKEAYAVRQIRLALLARLPVKDEFETTAQFTARLEKARKLTQQAMAAENAKPLLGSVLLDSVIAVPLSALQRAAFAARYDADREVMKSTVTLSNGILQADISMDIPTAKAAKPNVNALALGKLSGASGDFILLQVWVYDLATGKVWARKDAASINQDVMAKARELYDAGVDEEALAELRRALTVEPMNSEVYLLIGLIQQRQANLDQAISALKTALFWDSKMTAAHIMLGRIYLDKNDCPNALTYSQSALKLSPSNPEALALQRAIDTGGCR